LYVIQVDTTGARSNATGVGASVRMNGDAAWLNRGSIGASACGGEGFCSLTDGAW
jgi:hypothetical protein